MLEAKGFATVAGCAGRRVAGAGVLVAAIGLCVTEVGIERFDDLDMVENVLSRVEVLRDPFLNKLNGILLCWEKRFVEGIEAGWHDDVS